ncbi:hypothetical protein HYH03_013313 [Edaphochlamys debaryana]|uniref:Uncharacterized protein n=1 Tax=Edaphochlamys debaryana TaxID=47281 RepID=A0A836BT45_9CHLO|nr:hypothetical protein HYH03_013313 [Edaphochlamys debaryana]|eukprot:KAG2488171.1 hypothetical protein HYH03_013313 [Edaphochlamys debaryana]
MSLSPRSSSDESDGNGVLVKRPGAPRPAPAAASAALLRRAMDEGRVPELVLRGDVEPEAALSACGVALGMGTSSPARQAAAASSLVALATHPELRAAINPRSSLLDQLTWVVEQTKSPTALREAMRALLEVAGDPDWKRSRVRLAGCLGATAPGLEPDFSSFVLALEEVLGPVDGQEAAVRAALTEEGAAAALVPALHAPACGQAAFRCLQTMLTDPGAQDLRARTAAEALAAGALPALAPRLCAAVRAEAASALELMLLVAQEGGEGSGPYALRSALLAGPAGGSAALLAAAAELLHSDADPLGLRPALFSLLTRLLASRDVSPWQQLEAAPELVRSALEAAGGEPSGVGQSGALTVAAVRFAEQLLKCVMEESRPAGGGMGYAARQDPDTRSRLRSAALSVAGRLAAGPEAWREEAAVGFLWRALWLVPPGELRTGKDAARLIDQLASRAAEALKGLGPAAAGPDYRRLGSLLVASGGAWRVRTCPVVFAGTAAWDATAAILRLCCALLQCDGGEQPPVSPGALTDLALRVNACVACLRPGRALSGDSPPCLPLGLLSAAAEAEDATEGPLLSLHASDSSAQLRWSFEVAPSSPTSRTPTLASTTAQPLMAALGSAAGRLAEAALAAQEPGEGKGEAEGKGAGAGELYAAAVRAAVEVVAECFPRGEEPQTQLASWRLQQEQARAAKVEEELQWVVAKLNPSSSQDAVLRLAIIEGREGVVKALIKAGANKNRKDEDGKTPLVLAARHGRLEVVRALLAAGCEVNAADKGGFTALHWAPLSDNTAVIQALLGAGADKESKSKDGYTPLRCAASHGKTAAVQVLLEAGAKRDIKDKAGHTALYCASTKGYTAVVQALIKAGADKASKDKAGKTALDLARASGDKAMVALLEAPARA